MNHIYAYRNIISEAKAIYETTHLDAISTQINSIVDDEVKALLDSGKSNTAVSALKNKGLSRSDALKIIEISKIINQDLSDEDARDKEAQAVRKVNRQAAETSQAMDSERSLRRGRRKRRYRTEDVDNVNDK